MVHMVYWSVNYRQLSQWWMMGVITATQVSSRHRSLQCPHLLHIEQTTFKLESDQIYSVLYVLYCLTKTRNSQMRKLSCSFLACSQLPMYCRQICENAIEAVDLLSCECVGSYGTIRTILVQRSGQVVSTPASYWEGPGFKSWPEDRSSSQRLSEIFRSFPS